MIVPKLNYIHILSDNYVENEKKDMRLKYKDYNKIVISQMLGIRFKNED